MKQAKAFVPPFDSEFNSFCSWVVARSIGIDQFFQKYSLAFIDFTNADTLHDRAEPCFQKACPVELHIELLMIDHNKVVESIGSDLLVVEWQ